MKNKVLDMWFAIPTWCQMGAAMIVLLFSIFLLTQISLTGYIFLGFAVVALSILYVVCYIAYKLGKDLYTVLEDSKKKYQQGRK